MTENEVKRRGFKRKTIEKTIRAKINSWIKTLPEEIRDKVRDDYIVTGGAIASMLMGELPNDYDVYFQTPDVALLVASHYVSQLTTTDKVSRIEAKIVDNNRVSILIKSAGIYEDGVDIDDYRYFEQLSPEEMEKYFTKEPEEGEEKVKKEPYRPALISTNAISLHNDVQLVTRFIGTPEWIHTNYDYVHCTNWFTNKGGLVLRQEALEAILTKELKYVGSLYPLCSMFRLKKFIKRGWTITAGEMLKIGWDIAHLDLDNPTVLREQLVGVDAAYFFQLLSMLKGKENIDRTYLFECVNRVFDADEFNYGDRE